MFPVSRLIIAALAFGVMSVPNAESCTEAQHRQLAFVVGNWIVSDRSGKVTGTATISAQYHECVLVEIWRAVGTAHESLGVTGYDAESKQWHRDYLDGDGLVIAMDGTWNGQSIVMTGKDYHSPDFVRTHRLTWMPTNDGDLEQLWQTSTDAGHSWRLFRYARMRRISE